MLQGSVMDPLIERDSPSARLQRRTISHQRPTLFRATTIFAVLRSFGSIWKQDVQQAMPGALPVDILQPGNALSSGLAHSAADVVFHDSEETTYIDVFISHVSASSRLLKALAMLYQTNLSIATIVAFGTWFGEVVWIANARGIAGYGGDSHTALVLCYAPVAAFVICFLFGHVLRCGFRSRYWLDNLCVHQTDRDLKLFGISALPEYVANSNYMLVLLSRSYFERLWCIAEIGIFMIVKGGSQNLCILPLWLTPWLLGCFIAECMGVYMWACSMDWVQQILRFVDELWGGPLALRRFLAMLIIPGLMQAVIYMPASIVLYLSFRDKIESHRTMVDQLASFSIKEAKLTEESDRPIIESQLIALMEEDRFLGYSVEQPDASPLERFDHFIRTELLHHVQASAGGIQQLQYSFTYVLFMPFIFGMFGMVLDCDGNACPVSALEEGFSSVTEYLFATTFLWSAWVVMITPAMYAIIHRSLVRLHSFIPESSCRCCIGMVMVMCAYSGAALIGGCAYGLISNAMTTCSNVWILLLVAFLMCLVYVNVQLFSGKPMKR